MWFVKQFASNKYPLDFKWLQKINFSPKTVSKPGSHYIFYPKLKLTKNCLEKMAQKIANYNQKAQQMYQKNITNYFIYICYIFLCICYTKMHQREHFLKK